MSVDPSAPDPADVEELRRQLYDFLVNDVLRAERDGRLAPLSDKIAAAIRENVNQEVKRLIVSATRDNATQIAHEIRDKVAADVQTQVSQATRQQARFIAEEISRTLGQGGGRGLLEGSNIDRVGDEADGSPQISPLTPWRGDVSSGKHRGGSSRSMLPVPVLMLLLGLGAAAVLAVTMAPHLKEWLGGGSAGTVAANAQADTVRKDLCEKIDRFNLANISYTTSHDVFLKRNLPDAEKSLAQANEKQFSETLAALIKACPQPPREDGDAGGLVSVTSAVDSSAAGDTRP